MNFKTVAVITAIVTFVLGVGYLFAGALVVGRWEIEPTESVMLLGRRMAALYLGLSVIFFLARSTPASAVRTALCAGAVVTTSLLAMLGTYELAAGRVGNGMIPSVVIEALLAIAYISILVRERKVATGA